MNVPDKIREKLKDLPGKPGVYIMRDRNGRVIYVGKAVSLKNRVRSYFQQGSMRKADPKLRGLLNSVADLDYLVVKSEAEALVTEGQMIKDYKPRYNAYFKDDKRYQMLRINMNHPFPRVTISRVKKDDDALYFGPYVSSGVARVAKEFIEKTFGLRVCLPRVPGESDHTHCMNDVIRFCSAPCIGKISKEGYRERVEEACAFLRGERPEYLKQLREEMEKQSTAMNYEKAAYLRDTLLRLSRVVKERSVMTRDIAMKADDARAGIQQLQVELGLKEPPAVIECFDISNISGTFAVGSMVSAVDGLPQRNRYRMFRIRSVEGIDDPGMMAEVIRRRYSRLQQEGKPLPGLIVVDGGITQLRAAQGVLNELGLTDQPLAGLAKQFEEIYYEQGGSSIPIRLSKNSEALKVLQRIRDEAHRFAITYHRKLRSQRIRESLLDEIPGIGAKRKQVILKHFGSMARLRKAGLEELQEIPGVGPETAELLYRELHREGAQDEA